jgi:hypothetical protein
MANRKLFVEQLAADKKITASQIDKLVDYAQNKLKSPEDFAAWKETWDGVPSNSMFAKNVDSGPSNPSGDATQLTAEQQNIENAKQIVAQHRRSGMKEEQVKQTASYKLLESHNAL